MSKADGAALAAAEVRDAAPLFAALGDPTRLRLFLRLTSGPESITRLTDASKVSRQAVTKHLTVLAKVGLVRDAWRGRERVFSLEEARLAAARSYLERISAQWDAALDRLKRFVEE
jgi:DNA-binding transcriptional ArsR family regulator